MVERALRFAVGVCDDRVEVRVQHSGAEELVARGHLHRRLGQNLVLHNLQHPPQLGCAGTQFGLGSLGD